MGQIIPDISPDSKPEIPKPPQTEVTADDDGLEKEVIRVRDKFFGTLQNMGLSLEDATKVQHYLREQFEGDTEEILEKFMKSLEDFRKRIKESGFVEKKKGDKINASKEDAVIITRGGSIVIMKKMSGEMEWHVQYIPIAPRQGVHSVIKRSEGKGAILGNPTVGKSLLMMIENIPPRTSPVIFAATGSLQEPDAMENMEKSVYQSFAGMRSIPRTRRYKKEE